MKLFQGSSALSSISLQSGPEDRRKYGQSGFIIYKMAILQNSKLVYTAELHLPVLAPKHPVGYDYPGVS